MRPVVGYGGYRCAVAELYCGHCRLFIGAIWCHATTAATNLQPVMAPGHRFQDAREKGDEARKRKGLDVEGDENSETGISQCGLGVEDKDNLCNCFDDEVFFCNAFPSRIIEWSVDHHWAGQFRFLMA